MKAIDKSSSPLWVRILVWILVAGLVLGTAVVAVMTIIQWNDAPAPGETITINPEDLPPEILEQLEEMQRQQEQQEQLELVLGGEVTEDDGDPADEQAEGDQE